MRSPRLLLVPLLAVLAVVAGCGGDDDAAAPPDLGETDDALEVLAQDISFPNGTYAADAGRVGIVYENVGNIRHTLVIDGVEGFELDVNKKGDVDQAAVDLEPGTYSLFCDIPGHKAAGMIADLIVS